MIHVLHSIGWGLLTFVGFIVLAAIAGFTTDNDKHMGALIVLALLLSCAVFLVTLNVHN